MGEHADTLTKGVGPARHLLVLKRCDLHRDPVECHSRCDAFKNQRLNLLPPSVSVRLIHLGYMLRASSSLALPTCLAPLNTTTVSAHSPRVIPSADTTHVYALVVELTHVYVSTYFFFQKSNLNSLSSNLFGGIHQTSSGQVS